MIDKRNKKRSLPLGEPEECIDDSEDDNELTVALQKEREKAAHHIININHLCRAIKGTVCKCCTEQRENKIIGHIADEFATYIKNNNINIPNN
eukprot:7446218-Ditylum_brightwellii.AAC.1